MAWVCKECGGRKFIAAITAEQVGEFNESGEFEAEFDASIEAVTATQGYFCKKCGSEFDEIQEIAKWVEDV